MKCQKCAAKTKVVRSVAAIVAGSPCVIRERKCPECGFVGETTEAYSNQTTKQEKGEN